MKHTLLAIFIALLFSATINAQPVVGTVTKALPKIDLGIKLGADFEQLNGKTWAQSYQPGIIGGVFVGLHKHNVGVQAELLLNTSHYTTQNLIDSVHKGDFRATYFDIPVLFEYKVIPMVWLQVGPQFSSLVSVKSLNDAVSDAKSDFKSGAFSGVVGAEERLPVHIVAGVRYILGFTNINNESKTGITEAWNQHIIQVYVGFKFI
jgi:hypothetical protein